MWYGIICYCYFFLYFKKPRLMKFVFSLLPFNFYYYSIKYCRWAKFATPKYATLAYWFFWIKVTWETASARRTLTLLCLPERNFPCERLTASAPERDNSKMRRLCKHQSVPKPKFLYPVSSSQMFHSLKSKNKQTNKKTPWLGHLFRFQVYKTSEHTKLNLIFSC